MKTSIKNGRIVTAVDDYRADLFIEDERALIIGKSGALLRQRNSDGLLNSTKDRVA